MSKSGIGYMYFLDCQKGVKEKKNYYYLFVPVTMVFLTSFVICIVRATLPPVWEQSVNQSILRALSALIVD